jgi:hypothetical protein
MNWSVGSIVSAMSLGRPHLWAICVTLSSMGHVVRVERGRMRVGNELICSYGEHDDLKAKATKHHEFPFAKHAPRK